MMNQEMDSAPRQKKSTPREYKMYENWRVGCFAIGEFWHLKNVVGMAVDKFIATMFQWDLFPIRTSLRPLLKLKPLQNAYMGFKYDYFTAFEHSM